MRWGDQDSYGHINNVSQARYIEEARVRTFFLGKTREDTGLGGIVRDDKPDGFKMVVASQTMNYLRSLEYSPEPLEVEMWIARLGGSSIEMYQQFVVGESRQIATICKTTAVVVDGTFMKPVRLPESFREVAKEWMDEAVELRR